MNNLFRVVVYVNEVHKFVHIGSFTMFSKSGKKNRNFTIENCAAKALYLGASTLSKTNDNYYIEQGMTSSFYMRLLNTKVDDWIIEENIENLTQTEALNLKEKLVLAYENEGYSVSGAKNRTAVRNSVDSALCNKNNTIVHATKDKIYEIVGKLSAGLDIDLDKECKFVYKQYYTGKISSRREIWSYLYNKANAS